jgi:uncharacterized protein (DUF885 family)
MCHLAYVVVCSTIAGTCQPDHGTALPAADSAGSVDVVVKALADEFVEAYFDHSPESATLHGVPGRHHDRLSDNSKEALKAWEAREDAFLNRLRQIDPTRRASSSTRDCTRLGGPDSRPSTT